MDELVNHCLRELAFDGDLGKFFVFVCVIETGALCLVPSQGESGRVRTWDGRSWSANRVSWPWLTSSLTGCHPSRLRDFVVSYYSDSREQVVDDSYFAFIWSLVVCQPTVRVGTVPDGATTEVYIAPQQSQKRKSKGKDEGGDTSSSVTSLELLPDARSRTLEDLQSQYGEALRVAVDAETSLAAIVGSHIRVGVHLIVRWLLR